MYQRTLKIECIDANGTAKACPIKGLDSFAMRNFTNDAVFDDTLPVGDGLLEAGHRVPLDRLQTSLEDWLRRKSFLTHGETLRITEITR